MEPTTLEILAWLFLTIFTLIGGCALLFAYIAEMEERRISDENYWREYDKAHSY